MPTQRQTLIALAERGKLAIVRSLACTDLRKRARYRREAAGYADLVAIARVPLDHYLLIVRIAKPSI
jgi:hypothetical protein